MERGRLNLQQVGATIGVILSLVFVGYEIRQNTQVAQAGALQGTVEQILDWQVEAASDPDWIRIIHFLRTGGSFSELDSIDREKYRWMVSPTVRIMENRFRQMQLGVIDPSDTGVGGGTSNPAWFQSPHFLEWWSSYDQSQGWASDFLEFFETEVLEIR